MRSADLSDLGAIQINARQAEMIILGAVEPFDRDAIAAAPKLKAIVRRGVGFDNVDLVAATEAGIIVANVPDASIEEVSDHALASLLSLERRLPGLAALVADGQWTSDPAAVQRRRVQARRFDQLVLGIVGFGRIGAALARKARGVYGRVQVFDVVTPSAKRLEGLEFSALDQLLTTSDHISLHLPMAPDSRRLIGRAELATLRPGAILVNTARGGLIDEVALVEALHSGSLAAAALDVTEREPVDPASDLFAADLADRLLLTAHSAAWSQSAVTALAERSVGAVRQLLTGERPASVLNPEVLVSASLRMPELRRE